MRLKLWLKRIRGFKLRGLHKRRSKNMHRSKSMKYKPPLYMTKSPVFVSGNLSLPSLQKENPCFSPVLNQKAPYLVNQRMFTLSPLSPLPSPVLTSTPTGHNTPLALKDLLGFEAVNHNKKPNTFAHIAASFGCCKTESPGMDSSSNGAHTVFADHGQQNHLNTMKDHKDQGSSQASKAKWTGICKCVLVHVEKQIVTTHADARTKPRGMPDRASTWNSHTKQRNAMRNGLAKSTNSMEASESNASIDRQNALSMSRAKFSVCKNLTATSSLDRGKLPAGEHASVSTFPSQCPGIHPMHSRSAPLDARNALPKSFVANGNNFDDRRNPIRKPPFVCNSTSTQSFALSCTIPKQQSSLARDEFFAKKGGPSAPPSVSSMDKIHNWSSHDAKIAQRCAPLAHEWTAHQDQANQSGGLASNSVDQAVEGNKLSGFGSDEESSLLQADSYESSETFSISSHSPWLNEPKQVASSNALVDLEAHSRPWISMENHASIAKSQCKSDLNHEKSRRADAKAIRRSYQKVFTQKPVSMHHQSKTDTIILPSGISNANQELNLSSAHACNADKGGREAVKGSMAVEKRSRNPYVDFTDSMLDMILQNHMCSSKELEGLLQCFLSLNSLEHHDVIVQAFTEVWEKVVVGKNE